MHPKNCTHKTNHIRINRPDLSSIFSLITHARSNDQHILYGIPPPPPCVAEKGILMREKLTHEKSAALSTRSPPPLDLLPPHLRSLAAARTLPPHTLLIPPPFRCSSRSWAAQVRAGLYDGGRGFQDAAPVTRNPWEQAEQDTTWKIDLSRSAIPAGSLRDSQMTAAAATRTCHQ